MPFQFEAHPELPGVILVTPRVFEDERGWFQETYKRSDFERNGIAAVFCQDNHSRSTRRGVIRGLHYQMNPKAQGKLVRCTTGAIFDVAVDIRRGSPTYRKWVGVELRADKPGMLWIPEGFAHGFCTLTDVAEVVYKTTAEHSAQDERAIRWNDSELGIRWPVATPSLSDRDREAPSLAAAENNFTWVESE